MRHLKLFERFKRKKKSLKVHTLSGIALVVDGRLLLVQAKKHAGKDNVWSIPKGHIEGNSLESALKELEEETGINLDHKYHEMVEIDYKKGGVTKLMDVYVYYRDKSELAEYLDGWTIKSQFYDPNEIISARFFNHATCNNKIYVGMIDILDHLKL